MARDFAQIHLSIWNDDDFRALTPAAQHLYLVLLSSPTLNYCGVGDWRPAKTAALSKGSSRQAVEVAAGELSEARFILVDETTEEYLVRSFVRNDTVMNRPDMGTAVARAFSMVASEELRGVVVHELQRLKREEPDLGGWKSREIGPVLDRDPVDPETVKPLVPLHDGSMSDCMTDRSPHGSPHAIRVRSSMDPLMQSGMDPVMDPPTTATTTTTFREGGKLGVGGGPGEEGEDRIDGAEGGNTASAPSPSLDELAAAHAAQPTPPGVCATHPDGNPTGEACGGCREARLWREAQAEEAAAALRQAIDACEMCDGRGLVDTTDTSGRPVAVKCDHTAPPARPAATHTAFQPASDPNTRKALFNALNERTVPQPPF